MKSFIMTLVLFTVAMNTSFASGDKSHPVKPREVTITRDWK